MKRGNRPPGPNDTRRPDPRRELCEELATWLESPTVHRAAELLRNLESRAPDNSPPEPSPEISILEAPEKEESPRPISIWRPHHRDDGSWVFERPPAGLLGDHYADRRSFPIDAPDGRFRLCWFGESAAAGYLLAPGHTPAKILETRLGSRYEVIDLARTNEDLETLARTAEASLQLSPKAWVIFTGNNWTLLETPDLNPSAPSPAGLRDLARALRAGGVEGGVEGGVGGGLEEAIELARERLTRRVEASFSFLAGLAAGEKIPVVLVIPEANLAGWDTRQPVPWLPGDRSSRWHHKLETGLGALSRGNLSEARDAAEELLELDRGRNPTSHRLLAQVEMAAGDSGSALRSLRRHVDEGHYVTMGCLGSPQAGTFVQDLQRRLAARFGWQIVDLPKRFAEASELPGDDLFLDYCHLTDRGMQEAMAATVEAVRTLPEAPPVSGTGDPRAAPETLATAELGAAIHGAHRRLPLDSGGTYIRTYIRAWIRRALGSSPGIADAMLDLAEARISPGPEALAAAQQRNLRSPYRLSLQHGWRWDHLDFELLEAIQETLREARHDGEEMAAQIDRWLIELHAVERRRRELSRPPYLWTPVERPFAEAMGRSEGGRRATFRSLWPRSSFGLVSDGTGAVRLDLTVRLPEIVGFEAPRRGILEVFLDNRAVGSVDVSESWSSSALTLPHELLGPGARRLTLQWPSLPPAGDVAWAHAVSEMELGREADFFPIFGEVFELRASARRSS